MGISQSDHGESLLEIAIRLGQSASELTAFGVGLDGCVASCSAYFSLEPGSNSARVTNVTRPFIL